MNAAPFPVDPVLTGVTLAYRNQTLIADSVLPRVPVGTKEFKYSIFTKEEGFTIPETLVGRKGVPNEVEFTATEASGFCRDFGLDDFIPSDDVTQAANSNNGGNKYDPRGRAVEGLTDLILLDREVRAASLVFSAATYPTGNKTTLSGGSQWSDFANSNPVDAILAALDTPLMRPNVMTVGQAVWTKLRQHPKVIAAVYGLGGNAASGGVVTRQQFAELFELEELLVGQGFVNSNKPGQAAAYSRVWGKHCSLFHRNRNADTQRGLTFGFTAQYQGRIAGGIPEPKKGLRGGETIRVGETVRELVVAADCAYFFENAVA